MIQKTFNRVSDASRRKKMELFFRYCSPKPKALVLDLGGEAPASHQPGKQILTDYPYPERLVLLNLRLPNVRNAVNKVPGLKGVCGSGLELPFADKAFDVCYCNAVIEHLFSWENQVRFAHEIMRVAKRWFVTTPNRLFPFEPHMRLPFVTWLPQTWQHRIGYRIGYNHVSRRYKSGGDRTELQLLTRRQLHILFPGSRIIGNRLLGVAPTLVAIGGDDVGEVRF